MIRCPYCGATFKGLNNLKNHYWDAHHPPVCLACGKECASREGVMRHALHICRDVGYDDQHAMMFYLGLNGRGQSLSDSSRELARKGAEVAMRELEVEP